MLRVLASSLLLLAFAAPSGASADVPCDPPLCTILGNQDYGFLPPAFAIPAGIPVHFAVFDSVAHTVVEGLFETVPNACIRNFFTPTAGLSISFEVAGGKLFVKRPMTGGATGTFECRSATVLPDGTATLGYYCTVHPKTMNGVLVVQGVPGA